MTFLLIMGTQNIKSSSRQLARTLFLNYETIRKVYRSHDRIIKYCWRSCLNVLFKSLGNNKFLGGLCQTMAQSGMDMRGPTVSELNLNDFK